MKSLGPLVCRWIGRNLPDLADPTQPFRLVPWQVDLLNKWYAVDDAGRFIYRRGQARAPKGSGKSPLGAVLAVAELAGPVQFAGWDGRGNPKGRPWDVPVVQILATAEGQAVSNVYSLVERFLSLNDYAAAEALGIDVGKTRLYLKGTPGAELRPVTSAADAREGQRVTFGLLDESQLLVSASGGVELARTLMRNSAKTSGRVLELSNAYLAGAESVAERTEAAAKAGERGVLLYAITPSRIPEPTEPDSALLELLDEVYKGCHWVDTTRVLEEIRDPAVPWEDAKRFYFNVPGSDVSVFVDPGRWEELEAEAEPTDGKPSITLGFVGTPTFAALVGCTEANRVFVVEALSQPDHLAIRDTLKLVLDDYDVKAFYADPKGWTAEIESWQGVLGERCLAFPASSPRRMAGAIDRFRTAVATGELSQDGDADLASHVGTARIRETRLGYTLEAAGEGRPIALAVAACLALEARANVKPAPTKFWVILGDS
jgi:hypothetical protein